MTNNIIPVLDKNTIKYITKNITPEEAQYVKDIKSTLDDVNGTKASQDDVIYITKILAFSEKFKTLNWASENLQYKDTINNFKWVVENYKDDISEYIQSIIGEIKGAAISKLELPVSDNPLDIINELKICVQNWFILHEDEIEYEGARHLTSAFLAQIHKYVYLFISTIAKGMSGNYSFNREIKDSRIQREKIMLPITDDNRPDYDYMGNYMRKVEYRLLNRYIDKRLKQLNEE